MLLAVDVGNTNISLGVFDGEKILGRYRLTTQITRTSDEYGIVITDVMQMNGLFRENITDAVIASVVPAVMHSLTSGIIKYFNVKPLIVEAGVKTGIRIATENPKQIGADRIVDAAGAYGLYGGPVLVIDYGTATTYDLVDADGAFFNLSHSGEMAVCAFSDEEVGIDIERNKEFSDSLIGYVFDDREKKYICDRAGSEEERNALYTSLWTVKESLMKYNGQGLSMDPKTIFIDMENDYRAYHKGQECENLFFTRLKCDDYQICVCSTYKDFTDEIIKVDVI